MEENNQSFEAITLKQLQRFHAELQQLYDTNINLRMKYPTEPLRFYQSEEEIDTILQNFQQITQENIPAVVQSKILVSVLKLLNHPNSDINISCIQFLHELISQEPDNDEIFEVYYRMCAWLVESGLFQCLVQTLGKMNEEESVEEYEIALKILKIIETLTEQRDTTVDGLIGDTKILQYLSNRIMPNFVVSHKVIDDNKYVGSDVLAYILSNSEAGQLKFHQLCGMEVLIESLRPYLSKEPASSDEKEYLQNLFDCLNILLINPSEEIGKSRVIYHKMRANQIMLQFLKTKKEVSVSALKAIANSFILADSNAQQQICEDLIELGGLKYIFPIILRQGLRGKDVDEQMTIDQNCLNIVLSLIRSSSMVFKMRVQAKLTEKRFQKLEKLFQIRAEHMQNIGKQALKEVSAQDYMQKLKQGLSIVEVIDQIFCLLIFSESTVRHKLINLMRLYGVLASDIEFTIRNKYTYSGEGQQKIRLERVISESLPAIRNELKVEQTHQGNEE